MTLYKLQQTASEADESIVLSNIVKHSNVTISQQCRDSVSPNMSIKTSL